MKKLLLGAALLSVLAGCASSDKPYEASITNKERTSSAMQIVSTVGGQGYFDDQRLPKNALNETTTGDYLVGTAAGFVFDTALAGFMYTLAGSNMNSWDQTNVIVFLDETIYKGLSYQELYMKAFDIAIEAVGPSIIESKINFDDVTEVTPNYQDCFDFENSHQRLGRLCSIVGDYPAGEFYEQDGKGYIGAGLKYMDVSTPILRSSLNDDLVGVVETSTFVAVRFVADKAITYSLYSGSQWDLPSNVFVLDKLEKQNNRKVNTPAVLSSTESYLFLRPEDGKQVKIGFDDYVKNTDWVN